MHERVDSIIREIQNEHMVYDCLLDSLLTEVVASGVTLRVMGNLVKTCAYFTNHIHKEEELMYLTKFQSWSPHNKDHDNIIFIMNNLIDRRKPTHIESFISLRPLLLQHEERFEAPLMLHARACTPARPCLAMQSSQ